MRRIFFLTGIAAVAIMSLCLFLSNKYILALLALLAIVAIAVLLFFKNSPHTKLILFVLSISVLLGTRYYLFYNYQVRPVTELQGKTMKAELLISEIEEADTEYYVTAKVLKNEGNLSTGFKTNFYCSNQSSVLAVGDRISANLRCYPVSQQNKNSSYSRGIYIFCSLSSAPRVIAHTDTLNAKLARLRGVVQKRLFKYLPYDEASLMNGVLLSDTGYMRKSVFEALRRCGLTHLTAVSGTHLSIFCYSIYKLLQKSLNKSLSAWLTMPAVVFVMAISGFTPSVTRSGIMALLFLCGNGLFKRADALNSLGLTATAMLLINPFDLLSKGFVLSFLAMLGMVLVVPYFTRRLPKTHFKFGFINSILEYIPTSFISAAVASVCTAPASILFFGEVSLISPIINVLCVFPTMLCMMLGAVALFIPFLFYAVRPILSYVLWITKLSAELPFASVNAMPLYIKLWIGATLILIGIVVFFKRVKPLVCVLLSFLLLFTSIFTYRVLDMEVVHIAFANADNGIAVFMSKNNTCMAVGMGGEDVKYCVSDYCNANGVKTVPIVLLPSSEKEYCNINALADDKYKTILTVPGNEVMSRTLTGMGKTVKEIGEMTIVPFKNFKVKMVASGNGYVVQWISRDYTGLICMGTDTIPEEMYGADFIFTDKNVPPQYLAKNKTKVFLAGNTENKLSTVSGLLNRGMETYIIENQEMAELLIRNGKAVNIKRF